MSIAADSTPLAGQEQMDWWSGRFGNRGVLQLVVGDDVEFILGLVGLGTLVYVIVVRGNYDVLGSFVNILIFVIVFSFFARLMRGLTKTIQTSNRS